MMIRSIEAYIKTYHYSNFDQAYKQFDRSALVLLRQPLIQSQDDPITQQSLNENYEVYSYLSTLKIRDLQKVFNKLREPFETDQKSNIIDYNWHVDGILKNSQSYNKLTVEKRGGGDNHTASEIVEEDFLPVKNRQ